MIIGECEVHLLDYGRFRMDGGALFGIVPRKLWARAYPHVDEDNRVELVSRGLLIRMGQRIVVVDAGIGTKISDKERSIFDIRQEETPVAQALAEFGVSPEQVTDFIYTHLHFDHAGGATVLGPGGEVISQFVNARHYVQAAQLEWASSPSMKDRASYNAANWDVVIADGMMEILHGPSDFSPGVHLMPVHGHTPGMQMILVTDGQPCGKSVLLSVDLFPTAAHLPPHYVAAYDNLPLVALEEKENVLARAEQEGWIVLFGHDPFTTGGTVRRNHRGGWEIAEPLIV
jgi:glyoxylase-like metal-dependent hydrolase (beta-lactamase superfamily II)